MTQHLDEGVLHALLDGEIRAAELPAIEEHLRSCGACLMRLEEARAFRDEAERLVGEIELPVPSAAAGALETPPPGARPDWSRRLHLRPLAYAATLIAALGLGFGVRGWVGVPPARSTAPVAEGTPLAAAPVAPSESSLVDLVTPQQEVSPPAVRAPAASSPGTRTERSADSAPRSLAGRDAAAEEKERAADASADRSRRPAQRESGERRFEGRVTDESGRGIGGASVLVQGTALQARTAPDGGYRIEGQLPETSLVSARAIGHKTAAKTVSVPDSGAARLDFALPQDQFRLDEVVVTGADVPATPSLRRMIAPRSAGRPAFQSIEFPEALRRLGGRIRLVDGLVPTRLEASGDTVRLGYRVGPGQGIVWLQQFRAGDTVAFALIPPPDFPADSLARLTARVKP